LTVIADRGGDVSQLASSVDDRGAQAAFAIEGISDELERVLVELAELRALVSEQRSLLDELRECLAPEVPGQEPPEFTWRLIGS